MNNYENMDANALCDKFHKVFAKITDKHAPQKIATNKEKRRLDNPWLTEGILNSINNRYKLFGNTLINPTETVINTYKKYRNQLNRIIDLTKKKYYQYKIEKSQTNSKQIWKIINEIVGKKRTARQTTKS